MALGRPVALGIPPVPAPCCGCRRMRPWFVAFVGPGGHLPVSQAPAVLGSEHLARRVPASAGAVPGSARWPPRSVPSIAAPVRRDGRLPTPRPPLLPACEAAGRPPSRKRRSAEPSGGPDAHPAVPRARPFQGQRRSTRYWWFHRGRVPRSGLRPSRERWWPDAPNSSAARPGRHRRQRHKRSLRYRRRRSNRRAG